MKKVIKLKARIAEKEVKQIFIDTDFIRLDAALKLCDAVGSGLTFFLLPFPSLRSFPDR